MNRLAWFPSVLVLALSLANGAAQAADYKIGVVDIQKAFAAAPQGQAAGDKLQKEFGARNRDLVAEQKEVKALEDRLKKDGAIMSEAERNRLEAQYTEKGRKLEQDLRAFKEDFNFRQNEERQKIQETILKIAKSIGAEQGYDLVLAAGIIHASAKVDMTNAVIERLKKEGK